MQFSLQRMFASFALLAVGCAMFAWFPHWKQNDIPCWPFLIPAGCALVGAGIGNLFEQTARGALIGFELCLAAGVIALIVRVFSHLIG